MFTPKPGKPVSFAALKSALKKAGYTLDSAEIIASGTLVHDETGWWVRVEPAGQLFRLEGTSLEQTLSGADPDSSVEVVGNWRTEGEGSLAKETVTPREVKKLAAGPKAMAVSLNDAALDNMPAFRFERASFSRPEVEHDSTAMLNLPSKPLAPIRVSSPGLTVYKGGAVTPRLYFIDQHLGNLDVSRQAFNLAVSYTPSPRVQLEVEVPVSRTSFDDGITSGSGTGLGNITLWTKYRFFRKVKTYGDRQAALRFGLELPTGKSDAPSQAVINAPAFVRQQLTPINGGLSLHFDVSFSQAGGRFIFGGNAEAIVRSERDGFRMGHELRLNTDLEYVLLPRKYDVPGGELFLILETTFVHQGTGRLDGNVVPGSKATVYYVAPGLQYAAHPQFVIEGSVQLPVVRNTGPLVLRNDRNILLGVRYLF
ncbi:MAG TPA: transporter [Pyrinomonadaceae bacterium]|nr:transporter [Pyrinomonadaceae bacterium]